MNANTWQIRQKLEYKLMQHNRWKLSLETYNCLFTFRTLPTVARFKINIRGFKIFTQLEIQFIVFQTEYNGSLKLHPSSPNNFERIFYKSCYFNFTLNADKTLNFPPCFLTL